MMEESLGFVSMEIRLSVFSKKKKMIFVSFYLKPRTSSRLTERRVSSVIATPVATAHEKMASWRNTQAGIIRPSSPLFSVTVRVDLIDSQTYTQSRPQ